MRQLLTFVLGISVGAGVLLGIQHFKPGDAENQPYAGQDARQVTSLSAEDIRALKAGEGWGLAKPAEFNGFPGPAHVLEFANELELTDEQKQRIQASFETMQAKARELGPVLIEAEAALDEAFRGGKASPALLRERLASAEAARAALRETHLAAHLEITPLLTDEQKQQYESLRGYGSGHDGHHAAH